MEKLNISGNTYSIEKLISFLTYNAYFILLKRVVTKYNILLEIERKVVFLLTTSPLKNDANLQNGHY